MPAFTFEKIRPRSGVGPIPPLSRNSVASSSRSWAHFVEARVKRSKRKEKGVIARANPPIKSAPGSQPAGSRAGVTQQQAAPAFDPQMPQRD